MTKQASIKRQKSRAKKQLRRAKRKKQGRVKHKWNETRVKRSKKKAPPAPTGTGHLLCRFWEHFGFDTVLEKLGLVKHKGLPISTLLVVLISFGLMGANSDADLSDKIRENVTMAQICGTEIIDKQQLYRLRKRLSAEEYDKLLEHLLREMQKDPRTASRADGTISGDDTTILKSGQKMAGITLVYKSSEKRSGLGYVIPTTHYMDADKNYPLLMKIHQRTPAQQKAAKDKRARRREKIDRRRTADEKRWMSKQCESDERPELVTLRGSHLSHGLTAHCAMLSLPWVGISPISRSYEFSDGNSYKAKDLLTQKPNNWHILNEEGVRVSYLGTAKQKSLGQVKLWLVENTPNNSRDLYVLSDKTDQTQACTLIEQSIIGEQPEADNNKLLDMLGLTERSKSFIKAETAVFDRWFQATWFIKEVLKQGFKRVVSKARADRFYSLTPDGVAQNWKKWQETISPEQYQRHTVLGQAVNLAPLKLYDKDLGQIQLLFVQEIRRVKRKGKWVEEIGLCYALFCTDHKWKPQKLFQAHKLRWKIEEFYREVRQNHGFSKFHGRNLDAIHGHMVLATISFICVSLAKWWNSVLKDHSLGQIKSEIFNPVVQLERDPDGTVVVIFPPDWIDPFQLPDNPD